MGFRLCIKANMKEIHTFIQPINICGNIYLKGGRTNEKIVIIIFGCWMYNFI